MMKFTHSVSAAMLLSATVILSGCALSPNGVTDEPIVPTAKLTGAIHGGQQAISGAAINMYAVGSSGYGSASSSILNNGVTVTSASDGTGSFTLTGKYTCPGSNPLVYVTATGGSAGSGTNSAIAMMAALGPCNSLSSSTYITIDEVSTIAAVWPLAPFMASETAVGAPSTNLTGITNAFNDVNLLATLSTGTAPGATLPTNSVMPVATVNSLANILAACINSTGPTSSLCNTLFTNTTINAVTPSDTIGAALVMAKNPGNNVSNLFQLASTSPPFQPALTTSSAPNDFTLAATFTPTGNKVLSVAMDAAGSPWIVDGSSVRRLSPQGAVLVSATGLTGANSVAVDLTGNAWSANTDGSINKVTTAGTSTRYTGGGLTAPTSIAVDGQGQIWVTNTTSVSAFANTGTALGGSPFALTGGTPNDIAFNPH